MTQQGLPLEAAALRALSDLAPEQRRLRCEQGTARGHRQPDAFLTAVAVRVDLLPGRTTIGSGADADLRLEGVESLHAEVRHNEDDEYVLYSYAPTGGGRPNLPHSSEDARILRTGSRIEIGSWRLAFYREEFAAPRSTVRRPARGRVRLPETAAGSPLRVGGARLTRRRKGFADE